MTMGKPKPLGVLLGIAGALMLGVGIFNLTQTGNCGGEYPPCPAEAVPYTLMMPLGIVLSVIGVVAGGGFYVFCGLFASIGVGSLAAGIVGEGDLGFSLLFGGIFAVVGFGMMLMGPITSRVGRGKAAEAARLVATGGKAVGTLLDVQDTGVTINNNPRITLRMKVEPQDGSAPFEATKTVTVSRLEIPAVGQRFPVWYDRADHSKWAYGTRYDETASPDVKALFEAAQAAGGQAGVAFNPPAAASAPAAAPPTAAGSSLDQIAKLNELRMKGALSDEEFEVAKDRLLAQLGGSGTPAA